MYACEDSRLFENKDTQNLYDKSMGLVSIDPNLRCPSTSSDEAKKAHEDLEAFVLNMGSEFDRLLHAIDVAAKQVEIAFEELHEMVDGIQKNLVEHNDLDERSFRRYPDHHQNQSCSMLSPSTWSLYSLKRATEMAREGIRMLTSLLLLEKDFASLGFQTGLVSKMKPYLGSSPIFERFSHTKHSLEHCLYSILFKASNIPARTQRVMISNSASKISGKDNAEFQFERFCKKGINALESLAEWEEEQWSESLKTQFVTASKHVWELQNVLATAVCIHQVEILCPDPGSEFEELAMDPINYVSDDSFMFSVQFAVFHGFKVDGSVLIKPQVYLHAKGSLLPEN